MTGVPTRHPKWQMTNSPPPPSQGAKVILTIEVLPAIPVIEVQISLDIYTLDIYHFLLPLWSVSEFKAILMRFEHRILYFYAWIQEFI